MHYSLKEGISEVHYSFDGSDPVKQVVRLGSSFHPVPNRSCDGEFFYPEHVYYLVQAGGGIEDSNGVACREPTPIRSTWNQHRYVGCTPRFSICGIR